MEDFQDQDILDIPDGFEYDFGEVDLQGQRDQEEPMDYNSIILEEEESADAEKQNLFVLGKRTFLSKRIQSCLLSPLSMGCHNLSLTSMFQPRRRILTMILRFLLAPMRSW